MILIAHNKCVCAIGDATGFVRGAVHFIGKVHNSEFLCTWIYVVDRGRGGDFILV